MSERKELFERLMEHIGLDEEISQSFHMQQALLQQVEVHPEKRVWSFNFIFPTILPIELYKSFQQRLVDAFADIATVKMQVNVKESSFNEQLLNDYFSLILKECCDSATVRNCLAKCSLTLQDAHVLLKLNNEAMLGFFEQKYLSAFLACFKKQGFPHLSFQLLIDDEASKKANYLFEERKQELENDLVNEVQQIFIAKGQKLKENAKINKQKECFSHPISFGREIPKTKAITTMNSVTEEEKRIVFEGVIFAIDIRETKTGRKILNIKVTDYTSSFQMQKFANNEKEEAAFVALKKGSWLRVRGSVQYNDFARDLVMNITDLQEIKGPVRLDNASSEEKRVELHMHTNMSTMDAVSSAKDLVNQAKKWGHKAVAITDHAGAQSFPDAYHAAGNDIKVIYGVEGNVVDDKVPIAYNEQHIDLLDATYVVFDVETTGLSAFYNQLIQVAATKRHKGEVIATFDEFIDPGIPISAFTTQLTSITNEMVKGSKPLKQVLKEFKEFCQDAILVAHNATFDIDFINANYARNGIAEIAEPCIDTLEFARNLYPDLKKFGLGQLTKKFGVSLESHHLANYDAKATARLNWIFIKDAHEKLDVQFHDELNTKVSTKDAYKRARAFHATIYAQNQTGLKNLFKLISLSYVKYYHGKLARIPRSELKKYRKGLIIGSACSLGEVFQAMLEKGYEKAKKVAAFYDFIEIMPKAVYEPLLFNEVITSEKDLEEILRQLIKLGEELDKPVVATGDVHYLNPKDALYREILVRTLGFENPLNRSKNKDAPLPPMPKVHFRTTDEMLKEFAFLGAKKTKEVVVTNSNKVASWFETVIPVKKDLYTPKLKNSEEKIAKLTFKRAKKLYGTKLPEIVQARINKELNSIIGNGFSVIYLISQELVLRSNQRGFLVGSRGSVGSSLVATMIGITEVNPLPPHYYCPNCHHNEFFTKGEYGSGFDMPDIACPKCSEKLKKDGQDIPFETFLGFHGDKVPDIDLNFSGEDQARAHLDTRDLFGKDHVYRAGTIATVADRTAFGFVKAYERDNNLQLRNAEVERLTLGSTGVKRTTGQHPGGIIVIPQDMDVYDFTPIAYPAEDITSEWQTTHFDFHSIHDNVLKLDILGHDDPTMIRMLQNLSGIDPEAIPVDDPEVMKIFQGPEILGVTPEQIYAKTGTYGIPEFGTRFVMGMLEETRPTTFAELLQISGLSHGSNVWLKNAQELIQNGQASLKEVIGCRDDIMVYLMYAGLEPNMAFKIMERVRKGAWNSMPEDERETYLAAMREKKVPEWYIDSCTKIKYMFPKAHAAAYVLMALRVAYFKVHFPILYYCAYFSIRATDFDLAAMAGGLSAIKARMQKIRDKGLETSNKEKNLMTVFELCNEMLERGLHFSKIDLYKSEAENFIIDGDTLIPPFRAMDSLGENVAKQIVEARSEGGFLSKDDLRMRAGVSKTLIEKMSEQGILDGLPEENQLSLFDDFDKL
ncbi:MAG: PolC-type DNA polymerase III [Streptococcaceae bacterium]|jgi:DNA polymerase-3 subunit alpha (Gram-positive type)|nr:PolC-type DNA polymerase III [Streptococcaceae bacterium]